MATATERRLTPKQESRVALIIGKLAQPGDRHPMEVVHYEYNGDESLYLNVMARSHGIKFCDYCGEPADDCKCPTGYQI